jgi:hypothetical protein
MIDFFYAWWLYAGVETIFDDEEEEDDPETDD